MATWSGWEQQVLQDIGAPVTQANVDFLDTWQQFEGGGATYNPLNTTQSAEGSSSYNSAGVQNFTSPEEGAAATASTLENGYYPNLLAALQSGNPMANVSSSVISEINTWGTKGFANFLSGSGGTGFGSTTATTPSSTVQQLPGQPWSPGVELAIIIGSLAMVGWIALGAFEKTGTAVAA